MTLLETTKLPALKVFHQPFSGVHFYWDEYGMLCEIGGKKVHLGKSLLSANYILQCDHSKYFPVGHGQDWKLKCADCLCDLEITGVRELANLPEQAPPVVLMRDGPQPMLGKMVPYGEAKTNAPHFP